MLVALCVANFHHIRGIPLQAIDLFLGCEVEWHVGNLPEALK